MRVPEGTRLPVPPWRGFPYRETILEHDGPRLELLRTLSEQYYLAFWSESDEEIERWLYLPTSRGRALDVLAGTLPTGKALEEPEEGYLYVVDTNVRTGKIAAVIQTVASELDPGVLPLPDARLSIALLPEDIVTTRPRSHVLVTKLEGTNNNNNRVPAKVVSLFVGNLQRLVDALGQAVIGVPTLRGAIAESILNQTRLNAVAGVSGSFVLYLETDQSDDMLDYSTVSRVLEALSDLLDVDDDKSALIEKLLSLKGRVAQSYSDLLGVVSLSTSSTWIGWRHHKAGLRWERMLFPDKAQRIRSIIEMANTASQEILTLRGELFMGDLNTRRFGIQEENGERVTGHVDDDAIQDLRHITLGAYCETRIEPRLEVSVTTGEERTDYTLKHITALTQ